MQQVPDYELELMKIIWENGNWTLYAGIVGGLEARGESWTKNTIITLLSRLAEKRSLKPGKIGRRSEYVAVVMEEDHQAVQTEAFLHELYQGGAKGFVCTLIGKEIPPPEDYKGLKQFWENRGVSHD